MALVTTISFQVMNNATGQGSAINFPGGEGMLFIKASTGTGTMQLEFNVSDSWVPLPSWAGSTVLTVTTAGPVSYRFYAPPGKLRLNAGTFTSVTAYVVATR
jgi:hypothetical protein